MISRADVQAAYNRAEKLRPALVVAGGYAHSLHRTHPDYQRAWAEAEEAAERYETALKAAETLAHMRKCYRRSLRYAAQEAQGALFGGEV